jgi:hypothetical protein
VLGKSYRQSAELALDLARSNARWFWECADRYLHDASTLDSLMPYPYAHRLGLLADQRIRGGDRDRLERHLKEDLERVRDGALLERLHAEFPDARVW